MEDVKIVDLNNILDTVAELKESKLNEISTYTILVEEIAYKTDDIVTKFTVPSLDDLGTVNSFKREIVVGMMLNKLNNKNVVRTLGYKYVEKCNVPVRGLVKYECLEMYTQFVSGPTWKDFISSASFLQFKDLFKKLVDSHYELYKDIDFTHYDLHFLNVIITTIDNKLTPVMIDFGASHILTDEGHIGEKFIEANRYNDRSMWFHDIFKILGFTFQLTNQMYRIKQDEEIYEAEYDYELSTYSRLLKREDDEDYDDYIKRLKLPEHIVNSIERHMKRFQRKQNLKFQNEFRANTQNTSKISNFCMKMIKFFYPNFYLNDMIKYKAKDIYWTIWPTEEENKKWKYDDFLKHMAKFSR